MRRIFPLCSFSLISHVSKNYEEDKYNRICEANKQSTRLIKAFKEKCGIPGIAVRIIVNGKYHIDSSFGYSDIENMEKCKPDSLMRIASISKSFTSIIAAKLVEESVLDLDEDIEKYLPSFPIKVIDSKKAIITCRHLLSHRSGIRHYKREGQPDSSANNLPEYLNKERYNDTASALKMFQDDDLIFAPGKRYLYSSHAFVLLSAVLEKAAQNSKFYSSKSLTNMFGVLFKKLALENTHCEYNEKIFQNRSRQYKRDCKNLCLLECSPYVDNSNKWASGGLVSTCKDLSKFAEHLVNIWFEKIDGIISKKSLKMLWTSIPQNEWKNKSGMMQSYGLGWAIKENDERMYIGHTGGAIGGTSILSISLPKKEGLEDYVIVSILCNMENPSENIDVLAEEISKLFEDDNDI